MERGELERQVGGLVNRLPPLPESLERVMAAALDPAAGAERVMAAAREDPVLCAELLHLASQCGPAGEHPATIEAAVRAIDVSLLAQMLGAGFARETLAREFVSLAHLDEFFEHSREISETARVLAEVCGQPAVARESCAVAGLLHDMGRLVILLAANRTRTHLMGTNWEQMLTITQDERRLLGMDHCEVGAEVCRRWSFSPWLEEGVLRHHSPLDPVRAFSPPGALLFLAHFVAGSDFSGDILARMLPEELFARLGLTPADFDRAKTCYQRGG